MLSYRHPRVPGGVSPYHNAQWGTSSAGLGAKKEKCTLPGLVVVEMHH